MKNLSLNAVLEQYPIEVTKIEEHPSYYKLMTNKGTKILRTWDNPEELRLHHQHREDLVQFGFRKIDRFIRNNEGSPYVYQDGVGYTLTDNITGKIPTISDGDLKQIASTLAQFHLAAARVQIQKQWNPWSSQFSRGLGHFQRIEQQLRDKKQKEAMDETVLSQITTLQEQAKRSIELAEKTERNGFRNSSPPQWIHGNLKLPSFRIDAYQEGWVPNVTLPIYEIPAYDIAKLSTHLYQKSNFDIDKVILLLEEYQQYLGFTKEDKQWVISYLTFPHDLWKFLYSHYLVGIKPAMINSDHQLKELLGLRINQEQLIASLK